MSSGPQAEKRDPQYQILLQISAGFTAPAPHLGVAAGLVLTHGRPRLGARAVLFEARNFR